MNTDAITAKAKPDTLGFHRDMAAMLLGEQSPAVTYMDAQIVKAPNGRDEPVIAPENQLVHLLLTMHVRDQAHLAEVRAREVTAELF